ncbi:hypothetical protein LSTR_LSTR010285 [Laodelphax striatellus]|uniref:MADF domain-containing protein n=1 Tax=Laodelphax striatellus TaxID=195883 RepID=A0A482XQU2_LAOST|nr:hypothetical protein LSTR_LSTR010285 [Laodelphax striatellus]
MRSCHLSEQTSRSTLSQRSIASSNLEAVSDNCSRFSEVIVHLCVLFSSRYQLLHYKAFAYQYFSSLVCWEMNSSADRWSPEETIKLIREFAAKECLWNRKAPSFKNKEAKEEALNSIAENMNIPGFGVNEVKRKMRTLRSTFYQEKKKINNSLQSGADGDSVYTTNLAWYNEMKELLSCIHDSQSENPSRLTLNHEVNMAPQLLFDDYEIEIDCQNDSSSTRRAAKRNLRAISSDDITHSPPEYNKRPATEDSLLSSLVGQLQTISNNSNVQVDKDDCYDHFGKYVSSMLRMIGPPTAMRLQERITSMLTNAMCPPASNQQSTSTDFFQEQ